MRQAGRYMAEYRALRQNYTLLATVPHAGSRHRGHAAAGAPPRRRRGHSVLGSAAAAGADGHPVRFRQGRGTGHRASDSHRGRHRRASASSIRGSRSTFTFDAIRQVKRELGDRVPLIGFAGAPFTLASYAIEGGHSNNFALTKSPDVRGSGVVASARRQARHRRRGLPRGADRRRRRRGAGLRFVGRRAQRGRLSRVRAAAHAGDFSRRSAAACRRFTSASPAAPSCTRCAKPAAT